MRICVAWLLKHAATLLDPPLVRKAADSYKRAVQLDPNFAIAWARLCRADALYFFAPVGHRFRRLGRCSQTCVGECAETGPDLA